MFQSTSQRFAALAIVVAMAGSTTSAFAPMPAFGVSNSQMTTGSSSSRLFAGADEPTKIVEDLTSSAADFVEVRDLSGSSSSKKDDKKDDGDVNMKTVEDKTASAADFVEVRDISDDVSGATKIIEDKTASAADFVEVRDLTGED